LLHSVADRRLKTDAEVQARVEALRREIGSAEDRLRRLYRLVEDGSHGPGRPCSRSVSGGSRPAADKVASALERIESQTPASQLSTDRIARFGALMRENIAEGEIPSGRLTSDP